MSLSFTAFELIVFKVNSMRVLEKEIVSPYSMGKKNKHKLRKSKENEASDSSEEVSGLYIYGFSEFLLEYKLPLS